MAKLIPLALAYIMLTLGLELQLRDFLAIRHHPKAFFIGLANQCLLVPLAFLLCVLLLNPAPEIAFGLLLIGFCPGGVTSNLMTRLVGGEVALSITLTAVVSALSVLTLPLLTALAYRAYLGDTPVNFSLLGLGAKLLILSILPVILGMFLRHRFPHIIQTYHARLAQSATIVFILILLATLIAQWPLLVGVFMEIGWFLPLIALLLLLLATAIARQCALNAPLTRTLAVETSIQNGSVGMAVAVLIAPTQGALPEFALPALLYGVLMNAVVLPYIWWVNSRKTYLA